MPNNPMVYIIIRAFSHIIRLLISDGFFINGLLLRQIALHNISSLILNDVTMVDVYTIGWLKAYVPKAEIKEENCRSTSETMTSK
jgi:hypothetical protein